MRGTSSRHCLHNVCTQVASELLQEFTRCFSLSSSLTAPSNVLYAEAHKWTNAYPLNPRAPGGLQEGGLEGLGGVTGQKDALVGSFMIEREKRLGACGDW